MTTTTTYKEQLIEVIKEVGGRYRETPVKLAGGGETHIYLDIKGVLDRGSRVNLAALTMIEKLAEVQRSGLEVENVTAIGGPTMGADVLSHAITVLTELSPQSKTHPEEDLKWFSVRDKAKTDHGLGRWIEGAELGPEDRVILTDDVASTGKSLVEAYERVVATGAHVVAIMPLVDRADKAENLLRAHGRVFKDLYPELAEVPYLPVIRYAELGIESL